MASNELRCQSCLSVWRWIIQQYHQVPHKIRDNFIYSTCKICFEDKLLNTKYQKCSKHDDSLLTLHSGCCFWLVILILKTKSCTMSHLNRKEMTMYLWGQTDETSFNSLKGHFGTQKKKKSSSSGAIMKLQFSSESLFPWKSSCCNFLSQAFTHWVTSVKRSWSVPL